MADYPMYKVGITVKEPWAQDISYEVLDMTLYSVANGGDGCSYVALKSNIGVTPGTDDTVWLKSTQAGQSIYDLAVKYGHFDGTEEEFEAQYQAALQAAVDAASAASATNVEIQSAEELRVTAEQNRVSAETSRVSAEESRASAELTRENNELARSNNESGRSVAEQSRATAEENRVSAENSRVSAENNRANAEVDRRNTFEALEEDMETAIGQADAATAAANAINNQIVSAENSRVSAENGRVTAEGNRVTAEQERATAETSRATAENSRVTAEESRASAETSRATAETNRETRANTDHNTATSDHETATSDHNTAAEDHTTAAADHTQAVADHAVMAGYDTRLTNVEGEVSQLGQLFAIMQKAVTASGHRSTSFTVSVGMKLRFGVFMVAGSGTTFSVYHTSVASANRIFDTVSVGNITDEYTVPSGVDTIIIYVSTYGAGLSYLFKLYNSANNAWETDKLNTVDAYNFLKEYTPTVIETSLEVSSSIQYILPTSYNSDTLANKEGDIYVFINSLTAKLDEDTKIRFIATDNSVYDLFYDGKTLLPLKIFSGKRLKSIYIFEDSVVVAGNISLSVYCVPQSVIDMSRPLNGRTISCFGDSITEFRGSLQNKRYSDWLSDISGAKTHNYGIGGTQLVQRTTPSLTPTNNQECVAAFDICNLVTAWAANDFSYQDAAVNSGLLTDAQQTLYENKLALLKANPIADTDIVTIFGGTNDYTGGSAIGTANASNTDKGTVYGAVDVMVSSLLAAKPTLKIYFFSPIIRMFESTISLSTSSDVYVYTTAPEGKTLPQFCEVIADAVKLNHCPFCDWYWTLGWNVYNFSEYFGTEYTHPNRGYWYIAEKMYKFLLSN